MARRRWDTSCWVGDATRAHELLGWAPEVLLERGLHDLASFVVAHPHRYELARAQ
ncbi:MAG: hypothetical protein HZB15_02860 [Actinobacteria bacterium]|nr:hypothetical protein [Actinomycetota bacterium]